jgi:hypothetical protein
MHRRQQRSRAALEAQVPGGGPEIQSIAGAVAGETVVAAGIQISREAPARRATREGARATEAVSRLTASSSSVWLPAGNRMKARAAVGESSPNCRS